MYRLPGPEPKLKMPKSRRSRRQVELTDSAVAALRRRRAEQKVVALAGHVFTRDDGRSLAATTLWKRWRALLVKASGGPIRFHDARHTAATLLLGRGIHPNVVSEMLGHSTVVITLDTYSHVTPAMNRQAAAAMDELLGAGR